LAGTPSPSTAPQSLEARLVRAAATPDWSPFDLTRWQRLLLDRATEDDAFRTRLLRFVDVLPTSPSDAAVVGHLAAYFEGEGGLMGRALALATRPPLVPLVARGVVAGVHAMAGRFIAGATPQDAWPRLKRLVKHGMAFTVGLLGEAVLAEAEAAAYLAAYQDLIRDLAARAATTGRDQRWEGTPTVNVSVKLSALSALSAHFEPAVPDHVTREAGERLRALLRTARAAGAHVHVDMEQHRLRDLTHRVFETVLTDTEFSDFDGIGIVVQAYLKDTDQDIARLRALADRRRAPFTVRLVKGAYWDEECIVAAQQSWPVPVREEKTATDAWFERCAELLLEGWPNLRPAFGSHNPHTVASSIRWAAAAGLTPRDFEVQMLYGLAPDLAAAVAAKGYRLRHYVPAGAILPGMAYLVRRLLENTSNQAWFRNAAPTPRPAPPAPAATVGGPRFTNAAPAAFHELPVRAAMSQAIAEARAAFGRHYPLLLGEASTGDRLTDEVRYPTDPGVLVGTVAQATTEDAHRGIEVAARVLPIRAGRGPYERAAVMRRAAKLLEARRFAFAAIMVFESAKPWREADGVVTEAVDYPRYYADQAESLQHGSHLVEPPGETNEYLREPRASPR